MKSQPFLFLLIAEILGIVAAEVGEPDKAFCLIFLLVSLLIYGVFSLLRKTSFLSLLPLLVFFFFLAAWRFQSTQTKIPASTEIPNKAVVCEFEITECLRPSKKFNKYVAKCFGASQIYQQNGDEKILVYVAKGLPILFPGDAILSSSRLQVVPSSKNPYQFDYQKYLKRKNILFQTFIKSKFILKSGQNGVRRNISVIKYELKEKMKFFGFSDRASMFVAAIALGDRSLMDNGIRQQISSVGIMHLFAISGLHMGIVFSLFMLFTYPILLLWKFPNLRIMISLLCLWGFAYFVGFSPSVTRAAFMISFYYFTRIIHRPTHLLHTLFVTAFVILLISPSQLYDVGFQLSYLAVFFIAWLFPAVRNLFPKYRKKWKNYIFDLLCLSLVVQLGLSALLIYYFHQISVLFLPANLLFVPLMPVLIWLSFVLCILLNFSVMPEMLVDGVNFIFDLFFGGIERLAAMDWANFNHIYIDSYQLLFVFAFFVMLRFSLNRFNFKNILFLVFCIISVQWIHLWQIYQTRQNSELIVFHEYGSSILGIKKAQELHVFWTPKDSIQTYDYTLKPYIIRQMIDKIEFHDFGENDSTAYYVKRGNHIKFNNQIFSVMTKGKWNEKIETNDSIFYVFDGTNDSGDFNRLDSLPHKSHFTYKQGAFRKQRR